MLILEFLCVVHLKVESRPLHRVANRTQPVAEVVSNEITAD